jgi:hypothetical protein
MRLDRVLLPLFVVVGISFAQDTNFPVGPQYLVTTGSPMLLRPIATPSLSLSGETLAGTSELPTSSEPPAYAPIETVTFLANVYWGEHKPSEVVARRVETTIISPDATAGYMNAVANQFISPPPTASAEATQTAAGPGVVELSGSAMPTNLPASILDVGTTGGPDSVSLQPRWYETPLAEVAAYWKSRRRTTARVFTNSDVIRWRG